MADNSEVGQSAETGRAPGRLKEARGLELESVNLEVTDTAPEILEMDPRISTVPASLPRLSVVAAEEPLDRVHSSKSMRSGTQYSEADVVDDMGILDNTLGEGKGGLRSPVHFFELNSKIETERARKILAIDEPPKISELLAVQTVQPETTGRKGRGFRNSTGSAFPLRRGEPREVRNVDSEKPTADSDNSDPKSPRKNSGDSEGANKANPLRKVSSMMGNSLKAFQEQHLGRMGKTHSEHLMRVQKWLGGNVINEADMEDTIDTTYITESREDMERQWNTRITDVEMKAYRRVFAFFDRKNQCMVPAQLLASMMRTLGMNPTTSQVTEIELEVDNGGDKLIDFSEFVHAMERAQKLYRHQRQDVIEAFHFFDDDKTGDITLEKLKYLVMMSGEDLTIEEIDMVLADADLSGDGRLDFFEFSNLMCIGGLIQFEVKQEAVRRIQNFYRLMKRRKEKIKQNLEQFEAIANERALQTESQIRANGRYGTM